MAVPSEISLSDTQIDEIMNNEWNLRIATLSKDNSINLTPMWFVWADGRVYISARGQKVVNMRNNPFCTIIVDRNEQFPELQGIMMECDLRILEDRTAEEADPVLKAVRAEMGRKYNGGHGSPAVEDPQPVAATATGANRRWVVLEPKRIVTWDNYKLDRIKR